jgi:hypothetical protein
LYIFQHFTFRYANYGKNSANKNQMYTYLSNFSIKEMLPYSSPILPNQRNKQNNN